MATKLNMTLLLRRGAFADSYVLQAGEPGFHTGTKVLKIGDGTTTWGQLPFANQDEIAKLIKVVDDKVAALGDTYATDEEVRVIKEALEASIAQVKATADAAATKEYTDAELAKKVDKVEGKSLVSDTEIAKLAGVSEGANKVEASTTNGNIKIDGVETVVYTHPAKHSITDIEGLQDALDGKQSSGDFAAEDHTHTKDQITDFAHTHIASEITDLDATIKGYDYATKTEAQGYANAKDEAIAAAQKAGDDAQDAVDALAEFVGTLPEGRTEETIVAYIDAKTATVADNSDVEALEDRVKAIEDDYLVEADKTALEGKITAEETRAKGVEESLQTQINTIMSNPDAEGAINSINEFTQYVKDHGTIADGFRADIDKNKEDIAANAKAIADQATSDAATYETKTDAAQKLTDAKEYAKGYADGLNTAMDERVAALEKVDFDAYVDADTALKTELQKYTDEAIEEEVERADAAYDTKGAAAAAQAAAEQTAANALVEARTEISSEIDTDVSSAITAEVERANGAYDVKGAAAAAQAAAEAKAAELDAALKKELQDEIDADVKALADGAVADNTAAIAAINNTETGILAQAKKYADDNDANTTYTVAATTNALEFTVTPSEGEAQTVKLVAPTVDTGVMSVAAGNDDIVVSEADGTVTVSHKGYQTGTVTKSPADAAVPHFINGITISNGHVTGATVQSLADALASMEFILDGGNADGTATV